MEARRYKQPLTLGPGSTLGKKEKKWGLAKRKDSASEASQAVVLPTTNLASLTAIFLISPLFSGVFPHYGACMVPGYQPLYTLQSRSKLWTQLMTLLPIYFNLLRTFYIKVLRTIKWGVLNVPRPVACFQHELPTGLIFLTYSPGLYCQ